jgi:quinol monooxygenase YgiN
VNNGPPNNGMTTHSDFRRAEKLIPITRAEEGCIQYDLHQDNEEPAHFLFYENWASRELWQIHMNSP